MAGYPGAHRFTFVVTGPYMNMAVGTTRFGGTSFEVSGSLHLAPGVGLVQGSVSQKFLMGAAVLDEAIYDFTLTTVTPGP